MYRPKNIQERILHRLKITQGHLDKVVKMAENQDYCINIIHQSQAVQRALQEVDGVVLENHLKTCVANSIRKDKLEDSITEVMRVFEKSR